MRSVERAASSRPEPSQAAPASAAWVGLATLLAAAAAATALLGLDATTLDWQPTRAAAEPWRFFSAAAVHYSALHLFANLAGALLVAALGAAAPVPMRIAAAWVLAWPLTHLGLLLRPELAHYGGLSGVLHAGAATVAVFLLGTGAGRRRRIGAALGGVLVVKVLAEAPWGAALRHPPGWDIATAPSAHATGLVAGALCALAAEFLHRRRAAAGSHG